MLNTAEIFQNEALSYRKFSP